MKYSIALLFSFATTTALAANITPTEQKPVCLQRVYDQTHLKANPEQKLSELTVEVQRKTDVDGNNEPYTYNVAQVVGRSTANQAYYGNTAWCEYQNGIARCSIECDGGAFTLSKKGTWARFAVAKDYYFPLFKGTLEPDLDKVGGDDDYELPLNYDDKANNLFRLEEVPIERCQEAIKKVTEFDGGC